MATNRSSFAKRERDRAKKAKAAAKREKRLQPGDTDVDPDADDEATEPQPEVDEGQVLAQVAALHKQFDDGDIEFEEFEEKRNELMAQLMVD